MITVQKLLSFIVTCPLIAVGILAETWRMLRIFGWPGESGALAS
jgi:hypothetical protein